MRTRIYVCTYTYIYRAIANIKFFEFIFWYLSFEGREWKATIFLASCLLPLASCFLPFASCFLLLASFCIFIYSMYFSLFSETKIGRTLTMFWCTLNHSFHSKHLQQRKDVTTQSCLNSAHKQICCWRQGFSVLFIFKILFLTCRYLILKFFFPFIFSYWNDSSDLI